MREGKETGYKLLDSYIDFIQNFSEVAEQQKLISENSYKENYNALSIKWNALVPKWNELLETHKDTLATNETKNEQIEGLNQEIAQIIANTIQFDNISLGKVFKAIKNLPVKQLLAIIAFLIALLVGTFKLGSLYQENSMNSTNYELKKQNDRNQELLQQKDNEINNLKNRINIPKIPKDTTGVK